jgi:hypothetical protein
MGDRAGVAAAAAVVVVVAGGHGSDWEGRDRRREVNEIASGGFKYGVGYATRCFPTFV